MANSVDPDQTAPIGAVCSGFTLFASILNSSVMLGNYLQQTTSADDIFRCIFFLGALRVKRNKEPSIRLCYFFAPLSFFTFPTKMHHTLSIMTNCLQFGVKLDVYQIKGYDNV